MESEFMGLASLFIQYFFKERRPWLQRHWATDSAAASMTVNFISVRNETLNVCLYNININLARMLELIVTQTIHAAV